MNESKKEELDKKLHEYQYVYVLLNILPGKKPKYVEQTLTWIWKKIEKIENEKKKG